MSPDGHCYFIIPVTGSRVVAATGDVYSPEGVLLGNGPAECAALQATGRDRGDGGVQAGTCSGYGGACNAADPPDSGCCATRGGPDSQAQWAECSGYDGTCLGPDVYFPAYLQAQPATSECVGRAVRGRFNMISASWQVPPEPNRTHDVNAIVLWSGFQGGNSSLPGTFIVQPELWWKTAGPGYARGSWFMEAQILINAVPYAFPGGSDWGSAIVNVGDRIEGMAFIYAGASEVAGHGDVWEVTIRDVTTGGAEWVLFADLGLDDGGRPFSMNYVNLAVLEPQGLRTCNGLPDTTGYDVAVPGVYQVGSAWNDFVPVSSCLNVTQPDAGTAQIPHFVSCNYGSRWSGDAIGSLYWAQ